MNWTLTVSELRRRAGVALAGMFCLAVAATARATVGSQTNASLSSDYACVQRSAHSKLWQRAVHFCHSTLVKPIKH